MSVVINTNVDSLKIQANLTHATSKMSTSMQRMSSGLKVLNAKDDAAGCVIAARMAVQMEGNKIAQTNVQNGTAMLATAEGHLSVVEDNLSRIRDLTLQAKNGTYSAEEIKAMQDEVSERIAEIDRVSKSSKYSSLKLFDEGALQKDGATFQVGANSTDDNTITADKELFQKVEFYDLIDKNNKFSPVKAKIKEKYDDIEEGKEFDLTKMSATQLAAAINALDDGLDNLTSRRSIIGSAQNRLESALDTLTTQFENLSSAKSLIMDSDIANEASEYTQQNILQQVATSLLAQANQAPAVALSLI